MQKRGSCERAAYDPGAGRSMVWEPWRENMGTTDLFIIGNELLFWLSVCTLPHVPLKLSNIEKDEYDIRKEINGHHKNCLISSPLGSDLCTYFDDIYYCRWKSDSSTGFTGVREKHFTDLCTGDCDVARWFIQVEIGPCVPFLSIPPQKSQGENNGSTQSLFLVKV